MSLRLSNRLIFGAINGILYCRLPGPRSTGSSPGTRVLENYAKATTATAAKSLTSLLVARLKVISAQHVLIVFPLSFQVPKKRQVDPSVHFSFLLLQKKNTVNLTNDTEVHLRPQDKKPILQKQLLNNNHVVLSQLFTEAVHRLFPSNGTL